MYDKYCIHFKNLNLMPMLLYTQSTYFPLPPSLFSSIDLFLCVLGHNFFGELTINSCPKTITK